ncbi:hypothetical protein AJ79_06094 [Helicocarpus griseus UAMH5409]|uniref:Uncharacterized protein n=1 Tax=Helicocarpus griseus UAMH5409 TaxID=1447875 RepID=A0A2B7X8U6_9EURO|nr:hypothetical protein AJ79_06094 [Helicocarpus griseus UAMH5409]
MTYGSDIALTRSVELCFRKLELSMPDFRQEDLVSAQSTVPQTPPALNAKGSTNSASVLMHIPFCGVSVARSFVAAPQLFQVANILPTLAAEKRKQPN